MVSNLRVEDKLDGASNLISQKTRILFVLEENEIQNYVKKDISKLEDEGEKAKYKKNEAKEKRILIDSVKDLLIHHISQLQTAKAMYDSLVGLFESKTTSRRLALRNQLCCMKMTNLDSVATYFMQVSQLRDQLKSIGDLIEDVELVMVTLNGFLSSWESFIQSICGREELPKFD